MRSKQGFTMVELLVVLVIIGILAAVATPIFLNNTNRARASEAIATMGLIRQAMRDNRVNGTPYYDIAAGNLKNSESTAGAPGLSIELGTTRYFSNGAFSVVATNPTSTHFIDPPPPVDFIISVDGAAPNNSNCLAPGATAECAVKQTEVDKFQLEMDNSGRIYVTYDGTNWEEY